MAWKEQGPGELPGEAGPGEAGPGGGARAASARSRRGFLKAMGGAGALTAAGTSTALLAAPGEALARGPTARQSRRVQTFRIRQRAALIHLKEKDKRQRSNGDEQRYPDRRASFTKALPHDALGEVDLSAYRTLLEALASGDPADFEAIPLSWVADRRLANPQAAYVFDLVGRDSRATRVPPAPPFGSDAIAAEMGEVYWQAICRDVPFIDYETSDLIAAAVDDLNAFSAVLTPTENGEITPGTLFRGAAAGNSIGPYLSQFLWLDVPYGPSPIVQRYSAPIPGDDFMAGYDEWLAIPEGSPTHPAYPAGHSTVAGACATVLKAFVDEAFVFPEPMQASADGTALLPWSGEALTLGHEINKLAANISLGRCLAGVHYRTDASGLAVGEAQAIGMLQDYSLTYNEDFDGFTLTRFDGERIRIVDGHVLPAQRW